ncbi:uncharacterized protein FOMMEDRAFT_152852 [Fomitiporia mediterranea MF3/22]|uniref:uncharacterized protein n=1 Tax=Fomitiporia mediterranea (strain MF3/22) TaxID=694068 RepID=UPI00044083AB|nr:uncharacterized protein FOMMEDRAFT_152852 [Fomitiporia mediterranea MF3/22]EJD05529.1 hypothetical protein FOMMEDRAFT_152852 [Fomitiporia mediterranea MF3/22]
MPNDSFNNSMHPHTSSHSASQAIIDEHMLATMSMYDHSYGTTLSPMLSTLLVFTFLSAVHDTI